MQKTIPAPKYVPFRNEREARAELIVANQPGVLTSYAADPGEVILAPESYEAPMRRAGFVPCSMADMAAASAPKVPLNRQGPSETAPATASAPESPPAAPMAEEPPPAPSAPPKAPSRGKRIDGEPGVIPEGAK